jgi:glycosyltransferase involved in cell wall biosynthesis
VQTTALPFEVIVIDDGSESPPPKWLIEQVDKYPVKWLHQNHIGVSAARNMGLANARGEVVAFVDCDCLLHEQCLNALMVAVTDHNRDDYFQLRIRGCLSSLVGKAEELYQSVIQQSLILSDGRIRWLNTSGFAIRRIVGMRDRGTGLFDIRALRAQDTVLLSELIEKRQLPLFLPHAVVYHQPDLSISQYLVKGFRSAYLEGRTFRIIRAKGIEIRVRKAHRWKILRVMWEKSRDNLFGRRIFCLVVAAYALRTLGMLANEVVVASREMIPRRNQTR